MPKVIFRKNNQDIIALFPELAGSDDPEQCLTISESGVKSSIAAKDLFAQTAAAKQQDYMYLKEKLIEMGYEPLEIITREGKGAFDKRFRVIAFGNDNETQNDSK
jgi:hypothetical protein